MKYSRVEDVGFQQSTDYSTGTYPKLQCKAG
jgi:hypothetical protein